MLVELTLNGWMSFPGGVRETAWQLLKYRSPTLFALEHNNGAALGYGVSISVFAFASFC